MPDEARFGAQARFVNRAFLKRLRKSRSGSLKQGPLATTGRSCVALGASWVDLGILLGGSRALFATSWEPPSLGGGSVDSLLKLFSLLAGLLVASRIL